MKKNQFVTKYFSTNTIPGPGGFTGAFCQTYKKEVMPIEHQFFHKIEEKEGMLNTLFLRLVLPWYQNQTKKLQENKTSVFHEHEPEHIFHRTIHFMIFSKIVTN